MPPPRYLCRWAATGAADHAGCQFRFARGGPLILAFASPHLETHVARAGGAADGFHDVAGAESFGARLLSSSLGDGGRCRGWRWSLPRFQQSWCHDVTHTLKLRHLPARCE